MLESYGHGDSVFVTLTYDEEHHPKDGSVRRSEVQGFMKRLRFALAPRKVRFYAVGEYGDETWRPHYHVVLFGVSVFEEKEIERCWSRGFVQVVPLTVELAAYCVGYVTKKMTKESDSRLCGRMPEFSLMSRKPGIGAGAMAAVSAALMAEAKRRRSASSESAPVSVPTALRASGKLLPLGRYLRLVLRRGDVDEWFKSASAERLESVAKLLELHEEKGYRAAGAPHVAVETQRALSAVARVKIRSRRSL